VFLETIQLFETPLTPSQSRLLASTYSFNSTKNVEVLSRYFGVGLAAKDETVYQPTADLLGRVGRMKFVRPLYLQLAACDRKLAEETFEKNKSFYHPICRNMVMKDLKL
jgi:leukotriene-A4 hydrolase